MDSQYQIKELLSQQEIFNEKGFLIGLERGLHSTSKIYKNVSNNVQYNTANCGFDNTSIIML